jgi:hypothetical protein
MPLPSIASSKRLSMMGHSGTAAACGFKADELSQAGDDPSDAKSRPVATRLYEIMMQ